MASLPTGSTVFTSLPNGQSIYVLAGPGGFNFYGTDGSADDATLLFSFSSIGPGAASLIATLGNEALIFAVGDGTYELFGTDGTSGDTQTLLDYNANPTNSDYQFLGSVDGRDIFTIRDGLNYLVYGTDGTVAGTQLLIQSDFDGEGSDVGLEVISNQTGTLTIATWQGTSDAIYTTDGTAANTVLTHRGTLDTNGSATGNPEGTILIALFGGGTLTPGVWSGSYDTWIGQQWQFIDHDANGNVILDEAIYPNWTNLQLPNPDNSVTVDFPAVLNADVNETVAGLTVDAPGILDMIAQLTVNGPVLDDGAIYVSGSLIVNGTITVDAGAIISDASGQITSQGIIFTGPSQTLNIGTSSAASLVFDDSQTIDNATINLGGGSGNYSAGAISDLDTDGAGGETLTLGANLTINANATPLYSNYIGSDPYHTGAIAENVVNLGTINVNGGALELASNSFANRGTISVAAGVMLSFTSIDNTGGLITFEAGGSPSLSAYSTITGGTIIDSSSGANSNYNTLSGVTYDGTLTITNASLYIANGLTLRSLDGTTDGIANIGLLGVGSLVFRDSQTIDTATINLGGDSGNYSAGSISDLDTDGAGDKTLTLGAHLTVNANVSGTYYRGNYYGNYIGFDPYYTYDTAENVVNLGTINVNAATLHLASHNFANRGTIHVAAGAILDFTSIDNAGGLITFGAGGMPSLLAGTIIGGTIIDASDGMNFSGTTLSGVTYDGALTIANGYLEIASGLTLRSLDSTANGVANLGLSYFASLVFDDSQTIDNATINLGGGSGNYSAGAISDLDTDGAGGETLTLGANLTINANATPLYSNYIGSDPYHTGAIAENVVNLGTINVNGGNLDVSASNFTNTGSILGYGAVNLTGTNNGSIEARGGLLSLTGTIDGHGILAVDTGAILELGATTSETVVFAGANATLKFDNHLTFTGILGALADGDVIDLAGVTIYGPPTLNGTTLLVPTSAGNLTFVFATAPQGQFTAQSDNTRGTDLIFHATTLVQTTGSPGAVGGPGQAGGQGQTATAAANAPQPLNTAIAQGGAGGAAGAGASHGSAGGAGGSATASASATNPAGNATATADSTGGNGGAAAGNGASGGAGGVASNTTATATGATSASASVTQTGGNGGAGSQRDHNGGAGAGSSLSNAVSGSTSHGTLTLNQTAVGGNGGDSGGGFAGGGGAASSSLMYQDNTSAVIDATVTAQGGNGGSGQLYTPQGGAASVTATITGSGNVTTTGYAIGGAGGNGSAGPGGTAYAIVTSVAGDHATATANAGVDASGSNPAGNGFNGGNAAGAVAVASGAAAVATAVDTAGTGGGSAGAGKTGGVGGTASGTSATAIGVTAASASATQIGGAGGAGTGAANGGVGTGSNLVNAVAGSTQGGVLTLSQTAIGGDGGASDAGTGGAGGYGLSDLTFTDNTSAALLVTDTGIGGSGGASGGAGGNTWDAATITGAASVTVQTTANGGAAGAGGAQGGQAQAKATGTGAIVNATATADGGIGGVVGGIANATATGTGNAGTVTAVSQTGVTAGNLIVSVSGDATAAVGGTAIAFSQSAFGGTATPFTNADGAVAVMTANPSAGSVMGLIAQDPNTQAALGSNPAVFAVGEVGGEHSGTGAGVQTSTASTGITLDLLQLVNPADLFLAFDHTSASTSGISNVSLGVSADGMSLLTESFSSAAAATAWFTDHPLDLGSLASGTLAASSTLDLHVSLSVTSTHAGSSFDTQFLVASAPTNPHWPIT